jgi:hypothetical protein
MALRKRTVSVIGVAIFLSGCGGFSHPWSPMTEEDETVLACRSTYGFSPGTPEYDDCLRYVDQRRSKPHPLLPTPVPQQK